MNKNQVLSKRCPNCLTEDPWTSVAERQSQEINGKCGLLEVDLLKCGNCGFRIIPDNSVNYMLQQIRNTKNN